MWFLTRRLMTLAFAGLFVLGGTPREVCACLSAECRTACDYRALWVLAEWASATPERCCCCPHDTAVPEPDDERQLSHLPDCPCRTEIKQSDVLNAPRVLEFETALTGAWQALAHEPAISCPCQLDGGEDAPLQLAPDDPVSLAQILRI